MACYLGKLDHKSPTQLRVFLKDFSYSKHMYIVRSASWLCGIVCPGMVWWDCFSVIALGPLVYSAEVLAVLESTLGFHMNSPRKRINLDLLTS